MFGWAKLYMTGMSKSGSLSVAKAKKTNGSADGLR